MRTDCTVGQFGQLPGQYVSLRKNRATNSTHHFSHYLHHVFHVWDFLSVIPWSMTSLALRFHSAFLALVLTLILSALDHFNHGSLAG